MNWPKHLLSGKPLAPKPIRSGYPLSSAWVQTSSAPAQHESQPNGDSWQLEFDISGMSSRSTHIWIVEGFHLGLFYWSTQNWAPSCGRFYLWQGHYELLLAILSSSHNWAPGCGRLSTHCGISSFPPSTTSRAHHPLASRPSFP